MNVLGISGSMQANGNTAYLVKKILKAVTEANAEATCEFVSLGGHYITPCTGCFQCREKKACVITNDDWGRIAEKMVACDVLVIGTPVYYYDICGQLKNFIDRTYSLWHDRRLSGKYVVMVAVNADTGADRALETLEGFANAHEFIFAGSVTGKAFMPGEIRDDAAALETAVKVGQKIATLG
ncbi:flavodoxin family protein [Methanogenium sp. MK-MG]|uniref:flavodoxin family protein n=1 Tax=Methanogenium sp. MK-MG TaxID=2599926 RepID=UPI0013E9F4B5|nr:flavodoxin family protein [Methanogenium sp. MK-MG]KAF1078537.1 Iron-sulfur flavoprotein [Methanogenium sp. MK-MG]